MRYHSITIIVALAMFLGGAFGVQAHSHGTTTPEEVGNVSAITEVGEASTSTTLSFFYSPTCPHCRKEQAFLDDIEPQYPELVVVRYEVGKPENIDLMRAMAGEYGAERYLGQVPLTFVGSEYFVGFDSEKTTGRAIEAEIRRVLGYPAEPMDSDNGMLLSVPLLGTLDARDYSLSGLAIVLGVLDGFNVCSLGALVLIIGLSLKLQRRRAIVLFGGTFIVTTALVYGALIVAWYHIFELFSSYLDLMKIVVSLLALGGGIYFLKEYLRMRKEGAVCQLSESRLICKLMEKTGKAFEDTTRLFSVLAAVLAFAAVVAVVEFPCSAAVPVVFAGMLAEAGMGTLAYLGHIGLFVLFYMLDELIIFGIAAYRLKLWMTNGRFTKWAVLAEALILLTIGLWYLLTTVGLF